VELTQFHKLRTALQISARRGAAAELAEAATRVRRSLVMAGWFDDVEVGATDDVDNLVIAMCRFPARLSEALVAERLSQLWEEALRYPFWGAHSTLVWTDQVELEGATRAGAHGFYVTVHIVAQRAPQLAVVPAQRSGS
jgi:hypothetical protein